MNSLNLNNHNLRGLLIILVVCFIFFVSLSVGLALEDEAEDIIEAESESSESVEALTEEATDEAIEESEPKKKLLTEEELFAQLVSLDFKLLDVRWISFERQFCNFLSQFLHFLSNFTIMSSLKCNLSVFFLQS